MDNRQADVAITFIICQMHGVQSSYAASSCIFNKLKGTDRGIQTEERYCRIFIRMGDMSIKFQSLM
jgi:hypothetical protein